MAAYLLTCAMCGARFESSRPHSVTCSALCRDRRYRRDKARRETEDAERQAAEISATVGLLSALAASAAMRPDD